MEPNGHSEDASGDSETQQGPDPQWEALRAAIFGLQKHNVNGERERSLIERSAQAVEDIQERFHAEVKQAHKDYDIDPELDRINVTMEDDPGYSMYWQVARNEELREIEDNWVRCRRDRGKTLIRTAFEELRKGREEGRMLKLHVDTTAAQLRDGFEYAFRLW